MQVHPADHVEAMPRVKAIVEELGGRVIRPLVRSAWLVRLDLPIETSLREEIDRIVIEPYHPAFRLDPLIGRVALHDPERALSTVYILDVRLFPDTSLPATAKQIEALGGEVLRTTSRTLRIRLDRGRLADLAAIESVEIVFEYLPPRPQGEQTTTAVQTGSSLDRVTPFHSAGILGTGQILGVIDNGLQLDAADLSDTSVSAGLPGPTHRKVALYETAGPGGGAGDMQGCDALIAGGRTHGHGVTATAIGNARHGDVEYRATDSSGDTWSLDGLAPSARVGFIDAHITPVSGTICAGPDLDTLTLGDLYAPGDDASHLERLYLAAGARTFLLPFGSATNSYTLAATDIDEFLRDRPDATLFVPTGNGASLDTLNADVATLVDTATAKHAITVGAAAMPDRRVVTSGMGPVSASGRVAPLLMAPARHPVAGGGIGSEFFCRSDDNDSAAPVLCDIAQVTGGTSYAAAAAAGAGLLVRDWLAQGFYPDGTVTDADNAADRNENPSGNLIRAMLIASARFLGPGVDPSIEVDGLRRGDRFNNEQGYGRIELDRVLPLESWPASPSGIAIVDGTVQDLAGTLSGTINTVVGQVQTATFEVVDDRQELRVALAWTDWPGNDLVNDLHLELVAPSGRTWYGNYFTEDQNRNGMLDVIDEDCPSAFLDSTPFDGGFDRSKWSLEVCTRGDGSLPFHDQRHPHEAIFLSPNPQEAFDDAGAPLLKGGECAIGGDACGYAAQCSGGGECVGGTAQVEVGTWTVRVRGVALGTEVDLPYAVVVSGGLASQSKVRLDRSSFDCGGTASFTLLEFQETGDPLTQLSLEEIAARTRVEIYDSQGILRDHESGANLSIEHPDPFLPRYEISLPISDGTGYAPENGLLDVVSGDRLRVTYLDQNVDWSEGRPRTTEAEIDCRIRVRTNQVVFEQFGQDSAVRIDGGCESSARGNREFGFPDRYMDSGERTVYSVAFSFDGPGELREALASLRCVGVDGDSPASCLPGSRECPDPERRNNPPCESLEIVDSPRTIGRVPARAATSTSFSVRVGEIAGTQTIELLLAISGIADGRARTTLIAQRHTLNVDEVSRYYNTDFVHGGLEILDRDNNGRIDNPRTAAPGASGSGTDYWFETRTYSDMTSCTDPSGVPVVCNDSLQAPWNFDLNDGGFRSGLHTSTTEAAIPNTIAQWGEDKNFNNTLDGYCASDPATRCDRYPVDPQHCGVADNFDCVGVEDRDPVNSPVPRLDQSWSNSGGCGWQTRAPGTCLADPDLACYGDGDCGAGDTCGGSAGGGGIWHTGRIGPVGDLDCDPGVPTGDCQLFETIEGSGPAVWWELLMTPVITKVDRRVGPDGEPIATAEITDWGWNQAIDLPDNRTMVTVQFDNDTDRAEPVDLVGDHTNETIYNIAGGFGAVSGEGNPSLSRGWSVFAPLDPAGGSNSNGDAGNNRDGQNSCYFEGGAVATGVLPYLGLPGPPDDDAPEGYCASGVGETGGLDPHLNYCTTRCSLFDLACGTQADCQGSCINPGLAGFCSNVPSITCVSDTDCSLGLCQDTQCDGSCLGGRCTNTGDVCQTDIHCKESCVFTQARIDAFVTPNGPIRNHSISDWLGPDMRFDTLEDRQGPTGERFRAALGLRTIEALGNEPPEAGYGLGVDDMFIAWREFTLEEDQTDCEVNGSCATIALDRGNRFDGSGVLGITVNDASPSGNDCHGDGEIDPDADCNGNGVRDVVVLVRSEAEPAGERVYLDRTEFDTYAGTVAISTTYGPEGVLLVQTLGRGAGPAAGTDITVTYDDLDDGTGSPCRQQVDGALDSRIVATTTMFLETIDVVVTRNRLQDDQDNDGWADPGEIVEMSVELLNKSRVDLTGVELTLISDDPAIDCIRRPTVRFGDLAAGESRFTEIPFEFAVAAGVGRATVDQLLTATFTVSIRSDSAGQASSVQPITLDLDLDASGGGAPTTFFEGFEAQDGFGSFEPMEIDRFLNPPDNDLGNHGAGLQNSDGYRCQYTDPDWVWPFTTNAPTCYLNPTNQPDRFWWRIDSTRAATGFQSLHFGEWIDDQLGHTTPTAQLEAVRTSEPINLDPFGPASPQLRFKHQVSFVDHRTVNSRPDRGPDRGVVQLQNADIDGEPVGDWIKLYPYVNQYDSQANDNYFNCTFDPIDDGNDEGDFFDPTDPGRLQGPSSTCAPEFNFIDAGSTAVQPFDPSAIGDAVDGPGLAGETGPGTWVEPRVDLGRYRGRGIRLRFLATSLKLGGFLTWENAFTFNPDPRDDGWFIDDVTVTDTLTAPVTLLVDTRAPLVDASTCDPTCAHALVELICTGSATGSPCPAGVPGAAIKLDADSNGFLGLCLDGMTQYRFWIDADRDGAVGAADHLLRDWSELSSLLTVPLTTTEYLVEARCSSEPDCDGVAGVRVETECPVGDDGLVAGPGDQTFLATLPGRQRLLTFARSDELTWAEGIPIDVVHGDLNLLRAQHGLSGTVEGCTTDDDISGSAIVTPLLPGQARYYLARSAEKCNQRAGGSWGGVGETGDRDAPLAADEALCPD